jgi:hypothetical protein
VSILNTWSGDKWSSCQTINSILLTLCSLLNDSPLENEPGHTKKSREFVPYQKSIEFSNINFAICDIITLSKNKIPYPFQMFYSFMKEHFIKNYDKLLDFVGKKKNDDNNIYDVLIYRMTTKVDYISLKQKLIDTNCIVQTQNIINNEN